ncbi:MAG: hypothetical protein D3917_18470 [Candidatus Electrothrix sp. AX5]|nr:hypothetical protein [Candidatus Electrothrix sp. AX5]
MLADPGMAEQLLEFVCAVEVVIMAEDEAEQGLAETPGTEENRVGYPFQLFDILGFVDKIALIAHNGWVMGFAVENSSFHGLVMYRLVAGSRILLAVQAHIIHRSGLFVRSDKGCSGKMMLF